MFKTMILVVSALAIVALSILLRPRLGRADDGGTILGGRFSEQFAYTVTNPCNGVNFNGAPLTATAKVSAITADGFAQVAVFDSFSGSVTDSANDQYSVEGQSNALYNTLSFNDYDLPTLITFKGQHGAPSFTVLQHTQVLIDGLNTQKPKAIGGNFILTTCLAP